MKVNYRMLLEQIQFHAVIALRGFVRTVYGTLVAGLIALAVYGFIMIESESGYTAVFDFVAACATLAVALCNMYMMGGKKHGKRGNR